MPIREDYFIKVKNEAGKYKNKLIEKSAQILLSLDIPALDKRGIKRSAHLYEIFNQYPPFSLLRSISEKEIVSHSESLEHNMEKQPLSLYLHIPFCRKKCAFCSYFSLQGCSNNVKDKYASGIKKEFKLFLKKRHFKSRIVTSVYWGGGTSTLLNEGQIDDLAHYLRDNFEISSDAEISCETTPEEICEKKLECLLKNGFNRLSIGVQSFDDNPYKRLHTGRDSINAFKMSRRAGFKHINIDLLFGLSGQNLQNWGRSLEIAESLRPANVTAYPFSYVNAFGESIVPKGARINLPCEEERLLMHVMAIEKFAGSGYIQINPYQFISSWKYFFRQQEYKANNGEVCGVGISGRSFINNVESRNHRSLTRYYQMLEDGIFPFERARKLDKKEQMIKFFILSIQKSSGANRKEGGVDKALFQKMFGLSVNEVFGREIAVLKRPGLILESGQRISLTYLGLLYPTEASILFYLKPDIKKISRVNKKARIPG